MLKLTKLLIKLLAITFILGAIYVYCSGGLQIGFGGKFGDKKFTFQIQGQMSEIPKNITMSRILEVPEAQL